MVPGDSNSYQSLFEKIAWAELPDSLLSMEGTANLLRPSKQNPGEQIPRTHPLLTPQSVCARDAEAGGPAVAEGACEPHSSAPRQRRDSGRHYHTWLQHKAKIVYRPLDVFLQITDK